ncbi:MAG: hypothetical protein AAF974_10455 [Cyanobacteria bacterium P01_E01_bin.34]
MQNIPESETIRVETDDRPRVCYRSPKVRAIAVTMSPTEIIAVCLRLFTYVSSFTAPCTRQTGSTV